MDGVQPAVRCHDHLGLLLVQVVPLKLTPDQLTLVPWEPPIRPCDDRLQWIMTRWRIEHKYITAQAYMEFMSLTDQERTWFLLQI